MALLEQRGPMGETPLFVAALGGHVDVVKLLLEAGADYRSLNNCGQSALHGAAWAGSVACIRALMAAGANVNAVDARKYTPLLMAVQRRA